MTAISLPLRTNPRYTPSPDANPPYRTGHAMTDEMLEAVRRHRAVKWGVGPVPSPTDAALYRACGLDAIEIRTAARPLQGPMEHALPDGAVTRDVFGLWGARPVVEGDPEREARDLMAYVGVDVGAQPTPGARATIGPANIDAGPAAVALGGVADADPSDNTPAATTALAPLPGPLLVPEQMA